MKLFKQSFRNIYYLRINRFSEKNEESKTNTNSDQSEESKKINDNKFYIDYNQILKKESVNRYINMKTEQSIDKMKIKNIINIDNHLIQRNFLKMKTTDTNNYTTNDTLEKKHIPITEKLESLKINQIDEILVYEISSKTSKTIFFFKNFFYINAFLFVTHQYFFLTNYEYLFNTSISAHSLNLVLSIETLLSYFFYKNAVSMNAFEVSLNIPFETIEIKTIGLFSSRNINTHVYKMKDLQYSNINDKVSLTTNDGKCFILHEGGIWHQKELLEQIYE